MATGTNQRRRAHWPKLRLTQPGWWFVVLTVLVGLATVKSEVALVYALFGMMLGVLGVSALLSWWMLAGVSVGRDCPERAWQNQPVHLGYHLRNLRRRGSCLGLQVDELVRPASAIDTAAGYCLHLPGRAVFRAAGRFVARRRGAIRLAAVRISTIFPFGLVRAERTFDAPAKLLIWPARGGLKRKLLGRGAVETSSAAPSRATGGQDEFFGLREYRSGDNPRWIHWRRSASTLTPVIREMARPLPEVLWVVLDTFGEAGSVGELHRERMLRFAATLVDHAMARGYRVGLALAGRSGPRILKPSEGRAQRSDLLDALALADASTGAPLAETLRHLPRGSIAKSEMIVAGDAAQLAAAPLNALRAACRNVQLVTHEDLPRLFDDDVLAAVEAGNAL